MIDGCCPLQRGDFAGSYAGILRGTGTLQGAQKSWATGLCGNGSLQGGAKVLGDFARVICGDLNGSGSLQGGARSWATLQGSFAGICVAGGVCKELCQLAWWKCHG